RIRGGTCDEQWLWRGPLAHCGGRRRAGESQALARCGGGLRENTRSQRERGGRSSVERGSATRYSSSPAYLIAASRKHIDLDDSGELPGFEGSPLRFRVHDSVHGG